MLEGIIVLNTVHNFTESDQKVPCIFQMNSGLEKDRIYPREFFQ